MTSLISPKSMQFFLKAQFHFDKTQFADLMIISGIAGSISQVTLIYDPFLFCMFNFCFSDVLIILKDILISFCTIAATSHAHSSSCFWRREVAFYWPLLQLFSCTTKFIYTYIISMFLTYSETLFYWRCLKNSIADGALQHCLVLLGRSLASLLVLCCSVSLKTLSCSSQILYNNAFFENPTRVLQCFLEKLYCFYPCIWMRLS